MSTTSTKNMFWFGLALAGSTTAGLLGFLAYKRFLEMLKLKDLVDKNEVHSVEEVLKDIEKWAKTLDFEKNPRSTKSFVIRGRMHVDVPHVDPLSRDHFIHLVRWRQSADEEDDFELHQAATLRRQPAHGRRKL